MKKTCLFFIFFCFSIFTFSQFQCGNNFTDPRDGKIYHTINIGSQCWFTTNLNYGTYTQSISSGTPHSNVSNNSIVQKYCYNNIEDSCASLGGLYEWDEMMNYTTIEKVQGICPDGWHIPSDAEWKDLEIELGMSQSEADAVGQRGTDQGTKLLHTGTSGFDALFYGYRYVYGQFSGNQSEAYFWTSSINPSDANKSYYRALRDSHTKVERATDMQIHGFSVRCLLGQGMSIPEVDKNAFYLSDPIPNPSIVSTVIEYKLPQNVDDGYIVFYNALGVEVTRKYISISDNKLTVQNSDFNSGVYIYKLYYNGNLSYGKNLIIQK
ncbi:MAG: FISUMP domain-containing protein [Bacteroidota bacterium]